MTKQGKKAEAFHGGRVALHGGDCREVLRVLAEASIDSAVTDPPYHLTSNAKRFGGKRARAAKGAAYARGSAGFMGKAWDGGDVAFRPETWAEVLRVLKPGAHLVAFAAPKNFDLMLAAIRAAGFEVRDSIFELFSLSDLERRFIDSLTPDQGEALARLMDHSEAFGSLAWLFGCGFPKSLDVSKMIDKAAGAEREVVGEKRAGLARKARAGGEMCGGEASFEPLRRAAVTLPGTDDAARWSGWGTALKPAFEPICLARKPLAGTVAGRCWRTGRGRSTSTPAG